MTETLNNMRRAVDLMKDQLGEDAYKEWKSQLNKLENVIDGLYVQLQDRNGEIAMLRNKLEMKAEKEEEKEEDARLTTSETCIKRGWLALHNVSFLQGVSKSYWFKLTVQKLAWF